LGWFSNVQKSIGELLGEAHWLTIERSPQSKHHTMNLSKLGSERVTKEKIKMPHHEDVALYIVANGKC